MITFLYLFIFLSIVLITMAMRLKPALWISLLTAALIAISPALLIYPALLLSLWSLLFFCVLFTLVPKVRQLILTKHIFKKLCATFKPMSLTEEQAIKAGGIGWEGKLFLGNPDFNLLKNSPYPKLSEEEQAFLDGPTETLCDLLNDWNINENQNLPDKVWQFLKDHLFFGLIIDKASGGLGFSAIAQSTIVMKIASRSLTAAITVMVPNALGPSELILRYGTDEQKQHYLPRLSKGIEIPCFALTSLEAGSDATSLIDQGILFKDQGTKKLHIRLTFHKRYITLAPVATLLGLSFKLYDPEHLLGTQTDLGITLALVPTQHPGIKIGQRHKPMHMAFMNGPIQGQDVIIPIDWIIGGATYVGKGWEMMMECLSEGRGISLPALATGNAKLAAYITGAYAYLREQFHLSIGHFEGVQEVLARIGGLAYLSDAVRCFTASQIDTGIKPSLSSAISKYHLTEIGRQIGNDAMDIHGGRAIQRGPKNYMASVYDAIPISITAEGANILTRSLIIFGQGAIRCHPYLQKELTAIEKNSFPEFDHLLKKHIGFFLKNLSQTILLNLGLHSFFPVPFQGKSRYYAQQIKRMSSTLAFLSDITFMRFGNALKRKESISARLGDILSYLYMASALIKYQEHQNSILCHPGHIRPEAMTKDDKENRSNKDSNPCFYFGMAYCFHKIQIALDDLLNNFQNPILSFILKIIIFPFGKIYKAPADTLNKKISLLMMTDSWFRKKLKTHCFIKTVESDPVGRVELAFNACLENEPARNRIKAAIKEGKIIKKESWKLQVIEAIQANLITFTEANSLVEAEKRRLDSLEVDEFSNGEAD